MIATEQNIRISGIVNDSIVDGPGLRMAIFFQGCGRHCEGCHNPESWPLERGKEIQEEALYTSATKNPLLKGVTLSGGEPLLRAGAILRFAKSINARGLDLAIYTGYTFEEILEDGDENVLALLGWASTLIDGPFMLDKMSLVLPFRGSSNQRVLDLPKSLAASKAVATTDPAWRYDP